jgi:hypothetical protein
MRAAVRFVLVCVLIVGVVAAIGLAIAALADTAARDAVAWTLWIVGGLVVFVTASSGSPAEMMTGTRVVVGGRFTESPPLPQSPLQYALVGLACIGVGTLVFMLG